MEGMDENTLMMAGAAVATVAVTAVATCLMGGCSSSSSAENASSATRVSKKSTQAAAASSSTNAPSAQAKTDTAAKKKKKKRKKKKKPSAATAPGEKEEAEPTAAAAAVVAAATAPPAAAKGSSKQEEKKMESVRPTSEQDDEETDGGWSVVSSKSRSKSSGAAVAQQPKRKDRNRAAEKSGNAAADAAVPSSQPEQVTEVMEVAGSDIGRMIGQGASNIKAVQEQTSTRVSWEKSTEKRQTIPVSITGTADGVAAAKEMLTRLVSAQDGEVLHLRSSTIRMALFGKQGSRIRSIQDETSARLDVDREANTVTITGTPEAIAAAKEIVKQIIVESDHSQVVPIPSAGSIFGKGGQRIRSLQEKSGARLDVNSEALTVTVRGTKTQVAEAVKLIKEATRPGQPRDSPGAGEVQKDIDLGKAVPHVVGSQGANIKRIKEETGARIDIPSGTSIAYIFGRPEQVAQAEAKIMETVNQYKERVAASEKTFAAENAESEDSQGWTKVEAPSADASDWDAPAADEGW